MKRVMAWVSLIAVAVLVLTACTPASTSGGANLSQGTVEATQSTQCLGTAEAAIVDLNCRKITVAVENAYLPFNYILVATGEPGGWDYAALKEICTRLHCEPVFVEVAWDGMIQAVADKQYDMAADGITITEDRKKMVDFSDGYIRVDQRLLVRKGETRFDSIDAFAANEKLTLGTQVNTTNYETAKKFLPENRIKAFEQFPFAVQALLSGDVDAVLIDETAGQGYRGENAENLELIGPSISSDELGFVFPKGSDLVAPFNQALAAMKADGTLEKLNAYYFGPDFKIGEGDIK
uniref:Amino acid ABC transporter substrate-binding protein n=1 Tax=Anaerolinea thermolimosa TaxID=229919 RepID=A0A7C4PL12_9CHLR